MRCLRLMYPVVLTASLSEAAVLCWRPKYPAVLGLLSVLTELQADVPGGTSCKPQGRCCVALAPEVPCGTWATQCSLSCVLMYPVLKECNFQVVEYSGTSQNTLTTYDRPETRLKRTWSLRAFVGSCKVSAGTF